MPGLPRPIETGAAFGLALVLGVLGVASFAPVGAYWLAWPVATGLFLLLHHCRDARSAALIGFGYGLGLFGAGVSWIFVSLSVFGGMPVWLAGPATFLFCATLALYPALAGGLYKRLAPAGPVGRALAFALTLSAVDWLRSWFLTGFPWLLTGYSQGSPSPLAGFAPLVGVHGIGFLLLWCAALLPAWRIGVPMLFAVLLAGHALQDVAWTEPAGDPVTVALVQGNVPQEMKFRPEAFERTLHLYRDLIEAHPARLTVLPETAVPAFFDQLPPDYLDELRRLARRRDGDLLIGAILGDGVRYWNSAVSIGTAPTQAYSKSHLVPFGEIIPPGFTWFMAMASIPMSSFTAGPDRQAPLHVAGQDLAVNICYEDVFGEEIIRGAAAAGMLVNLSNTAWFGDSLAQPQHLQIARMRAAETGRPMLRATNTGMTAVIDAQGRLTAALPAFTTDVLETEVTPYRGLTPYVRWGNVPVLLLYLLALAGVLALRRRRPN